LSDYCTWMRHPLVVTVTGDRDLDEFEADRIQQRAVE
jgi:hypothetical protein